MEKVVEERAEEKVVGERVQEAVVEDSWLGPAPVMGGRGKKVNCKKCGQHLTEGQRNYDANNIQDLNIWLCHTC